MPLIVRGPLQNCNYLRLMWENHRYAIHVGRSKSVHGPFLDSDGRRTTEGGGMIVYASNHNRKVYAPGGLGVLSEGKQDILYYHYCKSTRS